MFRRTLGAILFSAILAAPCAADGSVTVSALGRLKTPIDTSDKVKIKKFPSRNVIPSIALGNTFEEDDLLTNTDDDELKLELKCPGGSLLSFHGRFEVLIQPPKEGFDCAVKVGSGKLDVLTDRPTEVNAAGKVMGSEGTRYVVIVEDDRKQLLVWTGVVQIGPAATRVTRSQSLELGGDSETTKVTEEQIGRWAGNYARFDLIKAKRGLTESEAARLDRCERRLAKAYAKVLRDPDDVRAQRALGRLRTSWTRIPRPLIFH